MECGVPQAGPNWKQKNKHSLDPPLLAPPHPPGLLASGAVQPVWDNVTVYSRSGPHTLAQAFGRAGGGVCGGWWADMQREVWGVGGGGGS